MLKNITSFLLLLFFVQVTNAQFLWLEDETNTRKIELTAAEEDVATGYTGNFTNPNTSGINTHTIVSKYNRPEGTKDLLSFNLFNYVTDLTDYTVTLKAYINIPTEELTSSNSKLRVYFWSSDEGNRTYEQLNFTVGQEWETFTFHFQNVAVPQNVLDVGGYDLMVLGLANGSIEIPATTYFFDEIYGSTDQTATTVDHPAAWLAGSWGATFPVWGGERLDSEVADGHDAIGGVQELVTELPAVGHVITNLSYFAHSHYFTIRDNTNVDVATEIDESIVPSAENQEIILEVLQTLKNSGKKIILYISTNYLNRASDETQLAWTAYYTANFGGDEYLAYKDLVQGFIPAVAEYADGYWFDTTGTLRDDGYLEDFVQMFKDADPGAAMSVSEFGHKHYIEGESVSVDSDGVEDEDERDYNVSNFRGNNSYSDFTRGHVSSLGGGAPPNSWGYEEFTMPAMVGNPWSMFEKKQSLKHAWFPIRASWHGTRSDLIFGIEDAYRFSKILIDAKAGVTLANTVSSTAGIAGYMTPDEMVIMKEINARLMSDPVPDYDTYVRPDGAYLVSETLDGTYTNEVDAGDGTWDTATNWTNSIIANGTGIATLERTIDLETNSYTVGQIQISGNTNAKTFSNGTIILEGTTSTNPDQVIRNRSNKPITVTCNVTVNVDDKELEIINNATAQLIFNTGTFALGSNTFNVDNKSTATTTIPVEFNGVVTGDSSSSINIINQDVSLGASSDFSGFTGSITFGGTNGLLTVNGVNTIEGSIGVLAASDGNSIIEFNANQSGLANLTVDTQALALDFDAAATAVEFTGYTESTTEGVVDLQNYVSGTLRIGTDVNGVSQTILNTWLIEGVEPADGMLVQDPDGYINVRTSVQNDRTFLQAAPNGEWQTATNWDTGTLPLTTDRALILYAGDLTLDQDRTIGNLKFQTNTARSFLDAGSTILTLDTPFASNSRLIDNSTSKAITIYPSINFMTSGVIYNRNRTGNQLTFTGGTIYINSNTITTDSRSTNSSNQYIVFNGPVDGDGIINVDDSEAGGATQGISLGANANFSTFTGTINAKNNPIVSSTTNAFGSALTLDGTASFEINVASTFTGSISRLATTAGTATVTFNANQSMGALTVDTQALAIDFDAAATAVEFTGYTTSTTEGVVNLQNYVSGTLRIGTSATSVPSAVLDTWTIDGVAANLVQDASGYIITTNTWNGSTNSDWTVGDNWSLTTAPSTTENVIIPTGLTNYPTIATVVTVNSISLADDASLVFSGIGTLTATTSVTYQRTIDANKWYLMSSPVVGESYDDDWVIANGIASGQGSNRGIGYFDNTSSDEQTGYWRYFQSEGNATAFNSGQGYSIIRSTAGTVMFIGSGLYTTSQTTTISQSDSNFNLVSNPFTGYLNLGDFFTDNNAANLLENNSIYVWNGDSSAYDTKVSELHSSYEVAHGQAFFVESGTIGGTLNLDINDVTHQSGSDTFQKTSNTFSKINIMMSDGNNTNRSAEIYFIEGATTGFDNGFDGELFGGTSHSFALFSELLEDNGKNYQIQSLPTSLSQSAIIPLGLIVAADKEIKIIAEIENLPPDTFVYLEDREKGTFTLLNDNGSFNFTTAQALTGKGRFYLHTSEKVLSTVNETLESVNIYKLNNSTLSIKGLSQGKANIKLFNTFGKQLMNTSFYSNGSQHKIYLPQLATGIYVVQLQTEKRQLNKKVVLE